jgi:hypothetical protein
MSWTRPITKGPNPTGRWGHTATLIGTDQLLIFGGHDGTRMLNDVHILDTGTLSRCLLVWETEFAIVRNIIS